MRWIVGIIFLIPVLYLALIFRLQPSDHLGSPEEAPALGRAVYDDYDVAAYALRGLNARLGRTPGRRDEPVWLQNEWEYTARLSNPPEPLAERYFIEYPLTCLPLFRLGYVWQDNLPPPPATILDGSYHHLVPFRPRTDAEQQLWRQFRNATRTHMVVMLFCLLSLIAVLAVGYEPGSVGPFWVLVLPGALYYSLNRFDVLPALLTALSLLCLGRGRLTWSAALLALATAVKVYPLLLAPLVCRYLWDRTPTRSVSEGNSLRDPLTWALVYAAALALIQLPPLLTWDAEAVWMPYHFQLNRMPFGPTLYTIGAVPDGMDAQHSLAALREGMKWLGSNEPLAKLLRLGTLAVTELLLLAWPITDLDSLLRRGAVIVIVFVSLAVFWSPQWFLWLTPLLIPLARNRRLLLAILIAQDLTIYVTFPLYWDNILGKDVPDWFGVMLNFMRFGLMFLTIGVVVRDEMRTSRPVAPRAGAVYT